MWSGDGNGNGNAYSMSRILLVIPARLGSRRFPGKMLAKLSGKELVLWSHSSALLQARELSFRTGDVVDVVVACDDGSIAGCVERAGGRALMTASELASGTDRVCAALRLMATDISYDIVVNYQGDLPRCPTGLLCAGVAALRDSGFDISTSVVVIDEEKARREDVVKTSVEGFTRDSGAEVATGVARDAYAGVVWGKAFAFTRTCEPLLALASETLASGMGEGLRYLQHIGVYIYRRSALERFVDFAPTRSEECYGLEQLRALENGMTIAAFLCSSAPIEINLASDVAAFEERLELDGGIGEL